MMNKGVRKHTQKPSSHAVMPIQTADKGGDGERGRLSGGGWSWPTNHGEDPERTGRHHHESNQEQDHRGSATEDNGLRKRHKFTELIGLTGCILRLASL